MCSSDLAQLASVNAARENAASVGSSPLFDQYGKRINDVGGAVQQAFQQWTRQDATGRALRGATLAGLGYATGQSDDDRIRKAGTALMLGGGLYGTGALSSETSKAFEDLALRVLAPASRSACGWLSWRRASRWLTSWRSPVNTRRLALHERPRWRSCQGSGDALAAAAVADVLTSAPAAAPTPARRPPTRRRPIPSAARAAQHRQRCRPPRLRPRRNHRQGRGSRPRAAMCGRPAPD